MDGVGWVEVWMVGDGRLLGALVAGTGRNRWEDRRMR